MARYGNTGYHKIIILIGTNIVSLPSRVARTAVTVSWRKQSLVFLLRWLNGPNHGSHKAFFVMTWCWNTLNQPWFFDLPFMLVVLFRLLNALVDEGYFDTVPIPSVNMRNWLGWTYFISFNDQCFLLFVQWLPFKHFGLSQGPFGTISLAKFLLRDEVNFGSIEILKPSSVTKESKNRLLYSRCYFDHLVPILSYSSSYKRTLFQAWQWWVKG